jgi:hypothetical protein
LITLLNARLGFPFITRLVPGIEQFVGVFVSIPLVPPVAVKFISPESEPLMETVPPPLQATSLATGIVQGYSQPISVGGGRGQRPEPTSDAQSLGCKGPRKLQSKSLTLKNGFCQLSVAGYYAKESP